MRPYEMIFAKEPTEQPAESQEAVRPYDMIFGSKQQKPKPPTPQQEEKPDTGIWAKARHDLNIGRTDRPAMTEQDIYNLETRQERTKGLLAEPDKPSWGQIGRAVVPAVTQGIGEIGAGALVSKLGQAVPNPYAKALAIATGGGLAYLSGEGMMDAITGERKSDAASDFTTGLLTSGGGAFVPEIFKSGWNVLPTPAKSAIKEILEKTGGKLPQSIKSLIPGLKVPLGAGDDSLTPLFQEALHSGDYATVSNFLKGNESVVKAHLSKFIPESEVTNLLSAATKASEGLASGVTVKKEVLEKIGDAITDVSLPEEYMVAFSKILTDVSDYEYKVVSDRFVNLVHGGVHPDEVIAGLQPLMDKLHISGRKTPEFLTRIQSRLGEIKVGGKGVAERFGLIGENKQIPLPLLKEWVELAGKEAADAVEHTVEGTNALAVKNKLLEILELSMPDSVPEYKFAKEEYAKYMGLFRDGNIGKILSRKGAELTGVEKMARLYKPNNPEALDSVIRTLGEGEGLTAIKNMALADLRSNTVTKDPGSFLTTNAYEAWFKKNKRLLERFGLEGEFADVHITVKELLSAERNNADFQKLILNKVTRKNKGEIISSLFSSSESGMAAKEIMGEIAGDPTALRAFKGIIREHLEKEAGAGGFSMEQMASLIEKYDPVIQVAFRGDTEGLKAMADVRKMAELLKDAIPKGVAQAKSTIPVDLARVTGQWQGVPVAGKIASNYQDKKMARLLEAMLDPEKAIEYEKFLNLGNTVAKSKLKHAIGPGATATIGVSGTPVIKFKREKPLEMMAP